MRKARAVVAVDVVPSLAALAAPDGPQPERPPLLPVASPLAHVPLPDSDAAHAARPDRHRAGMNGVMGEEGGRRGKGAGAMGLRVLEEVEGDAGDNDVRAVAFDSPPPLSDSSPGSGRSMRHLGSSRSMTISRGPSMGEEEDDDGDDDGLLSVRRGGAAPPLSLWDDDDSRLDSSRSNATPGSGRSFRSSSSSSGGGVSGGGRAPKKHTGVGPALQQRPLPQSMSMNRARMRLAGMKLDLRVLPSGPAGVLLPEQSAAQHLPAQGDTAAGPDGFSVGAALYVWQGAECRPPMQQQAQHAAAQIVRYERLPAAASLVHQGQEPHGFRAALSAQRLVRGGSGEWGVCLSVLEREGLTYLGQDAHQLPGHGALHSDPASMLPVLVAGGRGAGGASGRGVGDGGSEGGSRRGEWVVEEREEYSFDFECFNKGLDGGMPEGAGAMSAPPTKVLPHQHRGWLEATLPLNPAYSLPWESPNATPRGAQPSPALQTPAAAAAAGSGVGSAVASTSSALARLTVHDEEVDAGSKAGEAREARGGEEGSAPRKPVFAPLPLHAHTSMPSPSSFSPRSLGFFPPSGSGAYGAALSKFSKSAAAVRDPHRLKDQSGGSKVVVEGATGNGAGNGGGSGLRAGGLQVSELGSSGGGVRRGLPPLTPRTKGGMRVQQDKGWGETGQAGAEADTGGEEGGLMPGDELQAITEVDDPGLQRDHNEGGGDGDGDMGAGVGPVWLPSPRRGKPKLRAAWEEGEGDEAGEEEERGGRSEVGVVQGKEDEGMAAVLGALPQRRGRVVRGFQSTGSEAGGVDARGKTPKLPPRPALPPSAPFADSSSSSSATNLGAALPPAPRSSSLSKGRGDGGEGWGESGEGEVDKAGSSGMDAFGVPLTPRRRLPPRSAFGRGFKGDDADQAEDGGMRSKRQGVSRKEKDWPATGDDFGAEGGVGVEERDDMEVEDGMGAGMALPTPRRLGPQIKKIF
ncbi:unnamed protein product [Closterium sp. NIES-54]